MNRMHEWPAVNARRFELYVRWTLYILMGILPLNSAGLVFAASADRAGLLGAVGMFVLSLVVTGFNVIMARRSLDGVLRGERPSTPVWFHVAWAVSVVVLTVGIVRFLDSLPGAVVLGSLPVAGAMAALSPALTVRTTTIVSVLAVVTAGTLALVGVPQLLLTLVLFLVIVWTAWSSGWMLRVLRQLQEAHETAAQLVLAEERLRISRDLHDVFGRTLATISVKAELATELSRREQHQRAADEMAQIRHIANTAGAEVRRVVRGEREASWGDEVDGARALLASAGIDCVVAGDEIPEPFAEPLSWVIREGITNVLRHSRATRVSITTSVASDEVALTLTNDGAGGSLINRSGGTGLTSMAERLAASGGTVHPERDGEWFQLTASIPRGVPA